MNEFIVRIEVVEAGKEVRIGEVAEVTKDRVVYAQEAVRVFSEAMAVSIAQQAVLEARKRLKNLDETAEQASG